MIYVKNTKNCQILVRKSEQKIAHKGLCLEVGSTSVYSQFLKGVCVACVCLLLYEQEFIRVWVRGWWADGGGRAHVCASRKVCGGTLLGESFSRRAREIRAATPKNTCSQIKLGNWEIGSGHNFHSIRNLGKPLYPDFHTHDRLIRKLAF